MNLRDVFLRSVTDGDCLSFLEFMEQHNSKSDPFDIDEIFQALSKKDQCKLWSELRDMCGTLLLRISADEEQEQQLGDHTVSVSDVLSCLGGITSAAICALTTLEKAARPAAMMETALALHGALLSLPDDAHKLQNDIAHLCELWFADTDLDGREEFVTHTMPYLLIRSLMYGTVAEVKRVWGFRQSLLLMDFEDESCESLKHLLYQCSIHPLFLAQEEGRRFLSYLFGLNPAFSKQLHKTIKNQLPSCPLAVLTHYGEVYFRAWRVASGPYLETLEVYCIQDLMFCAVHAQRSGTYSMASRLRKVLGYFHQQKKQRGVDEALLKLYQPIIWRAFKVANPMVRANAAGLLMDVFPLQNPDAGNEEIDSLLQKQFDIFEDILMDPSPTVRATAVHGVCRITGVFWELIPAHVIKSLLTKILSELVFDSSSSAVRVAVFQGLKFLLDNRLSHPLLKPLLMNLQIQIHDTSEKVRLAFLDVLLLVKGMKAIKFWHIVPLANLLGQLEVDSSPAVRRKIIKLLINSFHPLDKGPDMQVARCIALWQENPGAARRFYQHVHLFTSVAATGKFLLLLCHYLLQYAKKGDPTDSSSSAAVVSDHEDKGTDESIVDKVEDLDGMCEVEVVAGLLETVAIIWAGMKDQLDKSANEGIKTKIVEKFTRAFQKLFLSVEHPRVQAALVIIVGFMPSDAVPNISQKFLSSLSSMSASASSQQYGPVLNCMCSWGKVSQVMDLIKKWVAEGINGLAHGSPQRPPGRQGGQRKKLVRLESQSQPRLLQALDLLSWLLSQPTCRVMVLELTEELREIANNLKDVMEILELRFSTSSAHELGIFFQGAFKAYCHIEIHLHSVEKDQKTEEGALSFMESVLVWADRVLVPELASTSREDPTNSDSPPKSKRPLEHEDAETTVVQLIETLLAAVTEMLILGMAEEGFCSHVVVFTTSLLRQGEHAWQFIPHLTKLMYQFAQRSSLDPNSNESIGQHSQMVLTSILQSLASCGNNRKLPQLLLSVKPSLAEILKLDQCTPRAKGSGVMAILMAAVLAELIQHTPEAQALESLVDLPPVSSCVLGILVKSQVLLRSLISELESCVVSGAMETVESYRAALVLIIAVLTGKKGVENMKSCVLHIQRCLEGLRRDSDEEEGSVIAAQRDPKAIQDLANVALNKLGVVA